MSKIIQDKDRLSDLVIEWYRSHGREGLPWRKNITPYKIWISEIMLQQTQVKTVIPYYLRFIKTYPTFNSLILAKEKYAAQPITTIDGVKIEFDKEWVHLRKSNTEPIIRIYSESESEDAANVLAQKIIADIQLFIQ